MTTSNPKARGEEGDVDLVNATGLKSVDDSEPMGMQEYGSEDEDDGRFEEGLD